MPLKSRKKVSSKKKTEPKNILQVEEKIKNKKYQTGKNSTDTMVDTPLEEEEQKKIISTDASEKKSIEDLEKQISQLLTENISLQQNLKTNEELIRNLKKNLLNFQQKTTIIENTSSDIEEIERWKDSALTMSQFIADKMGFTQGQVLEKFGLVDA